MKTVCAAASKLLIVKLNIIFHKGQLQDSDLRSTKGPRHVVQNAKEKEG